MERLPFLFLMSKMSAFYDEEKFSLISHVNMPFIIVLSRDIFE